MATRIEARSECDIVTELMLTNYDFHSTRGATFTIDLKEVSECLKQAQKDGAEVKSIRITLPEKLDGVCVFGLPVVVKKCEG